MLLVASVPRLTLPMVAPPLPDVDGVCCKCKGAGLVVVRPLAHDREVCWAVEHNEGVLRQVDLVDLMEDLLPLARIRCRQFMCVEVMPRWYLAAKQLRRLGHRPDATAQRCGSRSALFCSSGTPLSCASSWDRAHDVYM